MWQVALYKYYQGTAGALSTLVLPEPQASVLFAGNDNTSGVLSMCRKCVYGILEAGKALECAAKL